VNATARLVSGTRKYDRGLSQLLHVDLHWLDVVDCVKFKLGLTVHRCLSNKAPHYLADSCTLVSNIASRQRLRSAQRRHDTTAAHLAVGHFLSPVYRLELASGRAQRSRLYRKHFQTVAEDIFLRSISMDSALDMLMTMRYTNLRFIIYSWSSTITKFNATAH